MGGSDRIVVPVLACDALGPIRCRPAAYADLPGEPAPRTVEFGVPFYVNEKDVLREALRRLRDPLPESVAEANKLTNHLAITFHELPEDGDLPPATALTCELTKERDDGEIPAQLAAKPNPRAGAYDEAGVLLTTILGSPEAAALQAIRAELKGREAPEAKLARGVANCLLIYIAPTAALTQLVGMLADAVRSGDKPEDGRDFAQGQGLAFLYRQGDGPA